MKDEGLLGTIYKDGDIIVKEGTESREMYVIQSGKVKVVKGDVNAETVLAVLSNGDIFGEMSLIDAKPRSATVKAFGEARVLAIDHETFLKRVRVDPTLALRILRQMGMRIRELNTALSVTLDRLDDATEELIRVRKRFPAQSEALSKAVDELKTVEEELIRLRESFEARAEG